MLFKKKRGPKVYLSLRENKYSSSHDSEIFTFRKNMAVFYNGVTYLLDDVDYEIKQGGEEIEDEVILVVRPCVCAEYRTPLSLSSGERVNIYLDDEVLEGEAELIEKMDGWNKPPAYTVFYRCPGCQQNTNHRKEKWKVKLLPKDRFSKEVITSRWIPVFHSLGFLFDPNDEEE